MHKLTPKLKKFFSSQLFLTVIFTVLLLLLASPLWHVFKQKSSIDQEIDSLKTQISDLENKNNGLSKMIDYVKTDQYAEQKARTDLGLKKADEAVVVVKGSDLNSTSTDAAGNALFGLSAAPQTRNESNPEKWLKYFLAGK